MNELRDITNLQGIEIALRKQLENIAEGYIVVGYLLKKTRDEEIYTEKGYADVFEFAKQTFNISRTWATRFMQINDTYSIDGNSPKIQEKYRGYGSSKLSEMLTLPEEIRNEVPVTATVKEIREAKEVIRETEEKYSPQMSLCDVAQNDGNTKCEDDNEEEKNWIKTLVYEFFEIEGKSCFEKMVKWEKLDAGNDEAGIQKDIMMIVAPTKFRMFRMKKANALFGEFKIQVMPYNGQGEKETYTYIDFAMAFEGMFYPNYPDTSASDAEVYESVYHVPLREKKQQEVIKAEPLKEKKKEPEKKPSKKQNVEQQDVVPEVKPQTEEPEEEQQVPGQMGVEDYPEILPDNPEQSDTLEEQPEIENIMNEPEEEKQAHEITEEVIQEGEIIEDILRSGNFERIIRVLQKEFASPQGGWENWKKKVINLK